MLLLTPVRSDAGYGLRVAVFAFFKVKETLVFAKRRKAARCDHAVRRRILFMAARPYLQILLRSGKTRRRFESGFPEAAALIFRQNTATELGGTVVRKVPYRHWLL